MKYIQNCKGNIVEYEVDDTGALLYACDTEETHVLNDTAYFLYKSLEEPANAEQLFQRMEQVYIIPEEMQDSVMSDIRDCLSMLVDKALVHPTEERLD